MLQQTRNRGRMDLGTIDDVPNVDVILRSSTGGQKRVGLSVMRKSQLIVLLALFKALQTDGLVGWKTVQLSGPKVWFIPRCRTGSFDRRTHQSKSDARNVHEKDDTRKIMPLYLFSSKKSRVSAVGVSNQDIHTDSTEQQHQQQGPIPVMPSPLFVNLAQSQLELLAHSLHSPDGSERRKIGSMALYLPKENTDTGQLEFVPAVLYPHPSADRVFIASDADSGMPPTLPKTLTKLPGFYHAATLLPGYPMVSSSGLSSAGVGVVEEVMCDTRSRGGAAALSVPLFNGSQTVGVLLVWPSAQVGVHSSDLVVWTKEDKEQISRAAQSLSLALSMDVDRTDVQTQVDQVRVALSDSLHQVKNPLQALRTFGKLLQQRVASNDPGTDEGTTNDRGSVPQLLALAQHLMVQSERVADLLVPMDSLVSSLDSSKKPLYLNPAKPPEQTALAPVPDPKPWSEDPIEFGENGTDVRKNAKGETKVFAEEYFSQESQPQSSSLDSTEFDPPTPSHPSTTVGNEDLEMAFVPDVLAPILAAFQAIASERGIRFEVEGENEELPGVLVCPKALQESVANVLDNAFKYVVLSADGTRNLTPLVRVRLMANRGPYSPGVTIYVEDNGPGIRAEDQTAVFERGFRSPMTQSIKGTGIGLNISRSLLSRMGGLLDVAESPFGTAMKFVLFRQPDLE